MGQPRKACQRRAELDEGVKRIISINTQQSVRVGILANINKNDEVALCDRWPRPFEKVGMEIEYIPVGAQDLDSVLARIHGLLLPGGDSNIHPSFYDPRYKDKSLSSDDKRDLARDETAISLITKAYKHDMPTLGICRGMQEIIVAFGGQLQKLNTDIDHAKGYKALKDESGRPNFDQMDELVHPFIVQPGGVLDLIYEDKEFMVNSIHQEGMTQAQWKKPRNVRLNKNFVTEALAPDGVIEAISAKEKSFFVGVQSHFELEGPLHEALFAIFFQNIETYRMRQNQGS